jgi:hypothetical protein
MFSSHLTGHKLRLDDNHQPADADYRSHRCLLLEPYESHTHCGQRGVILVCSSWYVYLPLRFTPYLVT